MKIANPSIHAILRFSEFAVPTSTAMDTNAAIVRIINVVS